MNNNSLGKIAFTAILICLPSISIAQTCLVSTFSWLWWGNKALEDDGTYGPNLNPPTHSYSYWISTGAVTYINTDLDAGLGPNGEGEVHIINMNNGANNVLGTTTTTSGTTSCTSWSGNSPYDNTNCNSTTTRADAGEIILNDYYLATASFISNNAPEITIQHEVGHIFGMAHNFQSGCDTFMKNTFSVGMPNVLQSWEVSWINSVY